MSYRIAFSVSYAELASVFTGAAARGLNDLSDALLFLAISLMLNYFCL